MDQVLTGAESTLSHETRFVSAPSGGPHTIAEAVLAAFSMFTSCFGGGMMASSALAPLSAEDGGERSSYDPWQEVPELATLFRMG